MVLEKPRKVKSLRWGLPSSASPSVTTTHRPPRPLEPPAGAPGQLQQEAPLGLLWASHVLKHKQGWLSSQLLATDQGRPRPPCKFP